jgi:cytidylate kinase
MYRAVALLALENGDPLDDGAALGKLARETYFVFERTAVDHRIVVNRRDVTHAIRSPEVTRAASFVSVHPAVRAPLVERQRELARAGGVVMEGRDIGTVVFPEAELKIFLDAPAEVRGLRRMKDVESSQTNAEAVVKEIAARDQRDQNRETSPLRPANDAIRIDTAGLSAAEVAGRIVELARSRGASSLEKPG